MKTLLVATGNQGKMREFAELLADLPVRLCSLKDFPELEPAVEDGDSFAANAIKKAGLAAVATGLPVVADDSGLCVEALKGGPGVLSARYAGEDAGDDANNAKLLRELDGLEPQGRAAAFECVIAYCTPDGECRTFTGELRGIILEQAAGSGGFGYDPLFLIPEYGLTLAQLQLDVKNRISHRGRAAALLKDYLRTIL